MTNPTLTQELKPCQFCEDTFITAEGMVESNRGQQFCNNCGASGPHPAYDNFDGDWNHRPREQELIEALERQSDNMAFILNHHAMPEQWNEKFTRELEADRDILNKVKGVE